MGCVINKPLASKEADAVNICPGTVALGRAPGVLILATLSLPLHLLGTARAARQVELSAGPMFGDVPPPMRFCKHGSET